ncbi:MAG: zinc ribbon domain-containing protein, partial [Actinomycetota bacterium]|nr:zinc ribbon domain-containing protein [Actinomycetota bacterium]
MADGHRPVYCAQCGSVVDAGSNFCGVCGAHVSPPSQESVPTQQMPAPSYAPRASGGGNNRTLPLILGLAAVLLVLTADFSVVDPYRMMHTDRQFRRKVTQPFVHASRTQVNINATRCY